VTTPTPRPGAVLQPQTKVPPKTAAKPAVKSAAPVAGSKPALPEAKAARAAAPQYALPPVDPRLVIRIFEQIPEYKSKKITSLDILIRGMLQLGNTALAGSTGGFQDTPYTNFLQGLIRMAVERGSKGVVVNS